MQADMATRAWFQATNLGLCVKGIKKERSIRSEGGARELYGESSPSCQAWMPNLWTVRREDGLRKLYCSAGEESATAECKGIATVCTRARLWLCDTTSTLQCGQRGLLRSPQRWRVEFVGQRPCWSLKRVRWRPYERHLLAFSCRRDLINS